MRLFWSGFSGSSSSVISMGAASSGFWSRFRREDWEGVYLHFSEQTEAISSQSSWEREISGAGFSFSGEVVETNWGMEMEGEPSSAAKRAWSFWAPFRSLHLDVHSCSTSRMGCPPRPVISMTSSPSLTKNLLPGRSDSEASWALDWACFFLSTKTG